MRELKRLLPFVWPHRRKFLLSCLFGVLVSLLWGANLTIVYPIMQVLLKEKTLQTFVAEDLAEIRESLRGESAEIEKAESQVADFKTRLSPAQLSESGEFEHARHALVLHQAEVSRLQLSEKWMLWAEQIVQAPWFPQSVFRTFIFIIMVVVTSTFIKGLFMYLQDVLVGECSESAVADVRKELFRKMLSLDYQTFSHEGTAGLMSRFTHDTEQLSFGLSTIGGRFVREPLKCLACALIAFWCNWRLTLLSILVAPLMGVVLALLSTSLKRASRRMLESMTKIYRILEESFEGIKVVIAFGTSKKHQQMYESEYQNYFKKAVRVVRVDALVKPTMELLGIMSLFVALLPGAYLVLRHKTSIYGIKLAEQPMSVESLGMLYALLAGMLDPLRKMNVSMSGLRRSVTAFERILELFDTTPKVSDTADGVPLPRHSSSIEFRDVTFQYAPRGQSELRGPVLDHFSLKIKAGEVVALVGQNGCGKSTLVQLLPRFFDPQSGQILIDGTPIVNARIPDLRSQIGLVTQETILFDMTLRENITYGTTGVDQARLDIAAAKAHLGPILQQLPKGYDTQLGDKGRSLSGGQRQRVALARAILRDPSILILDEATSATDAESEGMIHQTLKEFVVGRTVLLITHTMSQSLLDLVTRVVVVDQGRVVADGSHNQLLATNSIYQRLFLSPSRKEAA